MPRSSAARKLARRLETVALVRGCCAGDDVPARDHADLVGLVLREATAADARHGEDAEIGLIGHRPNRRAMLCSGCPRRGWSRSRRDPRNSPRKERELQRLDAPSRCWRPRSRPALRNGWRTASRGRLGAQLLVDAVGGTCRVPRVPAVTRSPRSPRAPPPGTGWPGRGRVRPALRRQAEELLPASATDPAVTV